jgi:hypothetical protein
MNHRDQEKLLKEILPRGDESDFRDASLQFGLAGLRRERRRRHIVRFSAAAVVLLGLCIGFFRSQHATKPQRLVVQVQPAVSSSASSHVEFINDDQLLAVFTNQPVALIGKPGEQRLVFLGNSENKNAQRPY